MNPTDFADRIEASKERVSIFDVLTRLQVPTIKKGSTHFCACPAHHEKTESCRVGGNTPPAWKCFGCGKGGDQIHFIEAACQLSRADAIRSFFRMAGLADDDPKAPGVELVRVERQPQRARRIERRGKPELPAMAIGTPEQARRLAELRGVSLAAVEAMSRAGMLFFCRLYDFDCWIITDRERINAQARRLDGGKIFGVKAHTLADSWAKWPVGISSAGDNVLFVEGGPDLLAAFEVQCADSEEWSPVGMFGGAFGIHPAALPLFARKRVTIIPHNDGGKGDESAATWREQLLPVAGKVRVARIPGDTKDLNDYIRLEKRVKILP